MAFGKQKTYPELEKPEDYFPYIGHRIGTGTDPLGLRQSVQSTYSYRTTDSMRAEYKQERGAFGKIIVDIPEIHRAISADPGSVNILVPRHRSLFDFSLSQPFHHDMISERLMILSGDNLFVSKMNQALRAHGGFMFLRGDAVLSYGDLPKVFLTKDRYFKDVLPGYLEDQVFRSDVPNHDLLLYLEYEKDAKSGKNNGGRTKTGAMRPINWAMIKLLYDLGVKNGIKTYVTPVNCGFSKVPDAPYLVHPSKHKGTLKALRYLTEQNFVYHDYARKAEKDPRAALTGSVRYGEPILINDIADFQSLRGFKRFAETLEADIGKLEIVYPLYLIFKAMGTDTEISFKSLEDRMYGLHEHYKQKGARFHGLENASGHLLPLESFLEEAVEHLNANPRFGVREIKGSGFLKIRKGMLKSEDFKLQLWYANNIAHFD